MSKIAEAGFVEELLILVADALGELRVNPTPGGQDYTVVVRLTHGPQGIDVGQVEVAAGLPTVALGTAPLRTYPGISKKHPIDWVDHLPAG